MTLINMTKTQFRYALVSWARNEIGYAERPNNVTKYWDFLFRLGATLGNYNLYNASWCAGFIVYGLWDTGQVKTWGKSGLNPYFTPSMRNYALKNGLTKSKDNAQNGDIYLYNFPGGADTDHTGIAWPNPKTSTYRSIEGNTNYAGSGNGGSVMVKERPGSQIVACIDLIKWVESFGYTFQGNSTTKPPATPPKPSTTAPLKRPLLKLGMTGAYVRELQNLLKLHVNSKIGVDAQFGPETKTNVVAYQRKNGLTPDGEVGKATWSKLLGKPVEYL